MAIGLSEEKVMTLTQACEYLRQLQGRAKPPVKSTLWQWVRKGLNGVRLEAIVVGGSICTSQEAIQRFCDRLTRAAGLSDDSQMSEKLKGDGDARTRRVQRKSHEAAVESLRRQGVMV